jgi:hypothetical protein
MVFHLPGTLEPLSTVKGHSVDAARAMLGSDPRRDALIRSLQVRYAAAVARDDAVAKRALFKEAVYLNIHPDLMEGKADLIVTAREQDERGG